MGRTLNHWYRSNSKNFFTLAHSVMGGAHSLRSYKRSSDVLPEGPRHHRLRKPLPSCTRQGCSEKQTPPGVTRLRGVVLFKDIFRKCRLCWPPHDPMIERQAFHWAGTQVRRGSYEGKEPNDGQQETPSKRPRLYTGRWSEAWRKAIGLGQGK